MRRHLRLSALITTVALLAMACQTSSGPQGPESPAEGVIGEVAPGPSSGERRPSIDVGIFQEPTASSWWSYLVDPQVWSGYVLAGTACQLYQLTPPSFAVTPQLARHAVVDPVSDGDQWYVEVALHPQARWSDGEPITANDMVFTWQTVVDLQLGGQWLSGYQPAALGAGSTVAVEALDDHTVRIVFGGEPGLGAWPMGLGLASVMPEHYWAPIVADAADSEGLIAADGVGAPSCGPYVYVEREPGSYARVVANEHWWLAGTQVTHFADGSVRLRNAELDLDDRFGVTATSSEVVADYLTGPHMDEIVYVLYSQASVAVTALAEGEIAWLLTGAGLEPAAQDRLFDAPDVHLVTNPNYNLQFLGFNLERQPMSDQVFREAVATVIDREHLTRRVLGGAAIPLYTRMPSGNAAWFDSQAAAVIESRWANYASAAERVEAAVSLLTDSGYVWDVAPEVNLETGDVIVQGQGLTAPDGLRVPRLEVIHPTAGYDPLRNAAGLVVTQAIRDLGVDAVAVPMEFSQLVSRVINPASLDYDLAILGWFLGNPALPTFYDAFWRSDGPVNVTAYASDEYDEAVARFMATRDLAEAHEILWRELEPLLDRDLPYVPLFDTVRADGYRPSQVDFGFTRVLGGLSRVDGVRETILAPS